MREENNLECKWPDCHPIDSCTTRIALSFRVLLTYPNLGEEHKLCMHLIYIRLMHLSGIFTKNYHICVGWSLVNDRSP